MLPEFLLSLFPNHPDKSPPNNTLQTFLTPAAVIVTPSGLQLLPALGPLSTENGDLKTPLIRRA